MGCSHNYVFTQGHFYCTKCGKRSYGKSYKRKKGKKIVVITITLMIVGVGILFFNGTLEFNKTNLEKAVDNIYTEIPQIDEIQIKIEETSNEILKKIEDEQSRVEEEQRITDEKYIEDITTKVHELINQERTSHGLKTLSWNAKLAQASLNHSTDMAKRGYFQHDSPEGHDFSWRYSQVGFSCSVTLGNMIYSGGENIMYMEGYYGVERIATETVDGWMDSPGHRANILTSYFQSEGIGVAISGSEIYVTQNFC